MPLSDEELAAFQGSNVVALPRAASASVAPQPDAAAQAVNMAPKVGMPASVIGADLETYQQAERGQRAARAIQNNNWISDYVARNPMAAEVSSDDYDNLEKVSKAVQPFTVAGRQGGLLQAAPEFFLHTIPEAATLLSTAEGRQRLLTGLEKFGTQFASILATPGDVEKQGFDLHDPVDMERAQSLGLLIGLGKQSPKVEAFPRIGRSTPGEVDAFLHQAEGFKTRQEIDEFLAGKAAPGKDPKQVLQIEMAKADSAKLDDAIAAAEGSKTKARSPQMLEDFIAGHDTDNIHLPAEAVADLYRAESKTPAEGDGLFGFVPGLGRDLALGVETGAEVTVPASKYIAHIDPAIHEKIKDLIRFRPEGLTPEEAKTTKPEAAVELFHGSLSPETAIETGTHLGTVEAANQRINDLLELPPESRPMLTPQEPSPNVSRVILHPGNTIRLEDSAEWWPGELAQQFRNQGIMTEAEFADLEAKDFDFDPYQYLKEKGFNSIVYKNQHEAKGQDSYIVLDPTRVTRGFEKGSLEASTAFETEELGLRPLFSEPPPEMTKPEFERYNRRVKDAQQAILDKATKQVEAEKDARLTKEWKAQEATVREEMSGAVAARPDVATESFLKKGKLKLDDEAINSILSERSRTQGFQGQALRVEAQLPSVQAGFTRLYRGNRPDEIGKATTFTNSLPGIALPFRKAYGGDLSYIDVPTADLAKYEQRGAVAPGAEFNLPATLAKQAKAANFDRLNDHIPSILREKGGAHPDDIAPFVGYESGIELVNALNDHILDRKLRGESPTKQLERLITEATSAAMEARHGDFGRQIAEEARALALDDIHFDLLSDELRALARQAGGQPPLSKDTLKEWVSGQFSSLDTKEAADFGRWQKAAGREGRKAEQALLKGDAVEAFKAKQRQVLSWLMAKEANRFAKDISKIAAKIDRVQGAKEIASMDQEHFDQLRSMLASAGFAPKHPIPQGLRPLADFVAGSDGQLAVASWLTDGSSRPADPSKLTAQEMRDLGKSIDSMMHVGRAVKTLDSARGKAELQNVVFDIKSELDRFDLVQQPLNPSVGQRAKSLVRWVNAWSLLVERMLDYTDKFDPNGPLTTYLDRPLRDANVKEIQLNEKTTRKLQSLAKLTDNSINDIIPNSVIPSELNESGFLDMNRRNLRQLMGYMGSESGIKKVTQGFGVDAADVWKLINDNATKADWQWVAGMHELFADLWKESAEMQERDTGVAADPIKAKAMKSEKHGDFPGGYWPIKYDKMRSNIEGHIAAKSDLFDKHYVQAVTPQAYTEARTQFAAPLDLSGQLIGSHIRGMIHDIAFREAVRNAAKLINNAEFMAAMTQKWSKEYAGLLPGWIKDIANAQRVDDSYAMGAARWSALVRQNITSTLIALNPGTVIKHGMSALGMSIERVGAKELGSAAVELGAKAMIQSANELIKGKGEPPTQERLDALKAVTDPSEIGDQVRQFIIDSSAVMRNRQRAAADNIREAYQQNIKAGAGQLFVDARNAWMDIGRFPVALSDAVSAMPTWLAAYKEAMTRGEDHTQAVFEADKQVSRAHGSSFIGDRPRIMRTDEVMRWVTPLYNFWNHMQNNYMQWMWDAGAFAKGREEPGANIGSLGRRVFWLAIWSVVAEEIASPALDEDRRSLGQKVFMATLRHFGAGYIGLRDVTNAAAHGYEPSVGLLGTLSKEIAGTGREMARVGAGKELSKNWLIHALTALGFATGLGGAQLGKTSSYLKDRFTGAERGPKSWAELRQGLRTGHSKARIHK